MDRIAVQYVALVRVLHFSASSLLLLLLKSCEQIGVITLVNCKMAVVFRS